MKARQLNCCGRSLLVTPGRYRWSLFTVVVLYSFIFRLNRIRSYPILSFLVDARAQSTTTVPRSECSGAEPLPSLNNFLSRGGHANIVGRYLCAQYIKLYFIIWKKSLPPIYYYEYWGSVLLPRRPRLWSLNQFVYEEDHRSMLSSYLPRGPSYTFTCIDD